MARKKLDTLTEQMYYLLLTLHEPRHGYAIMEKVKEMTDGQLQIGPGTLYTLLSRFEAEWVIQLHHVEENRKVYCLTDRGRQLLQQEFERLHRLVADGEAILGKEDRA